MHHNPLRRLGIRLLALLVVFGISTGILYWINVPSPMTWAGMVTMLSWVTFLNKVM